MARTEMAPHPHDEEVDRNQEAKLPPVTEADLAPYYGKWADDTAYELFGWDFDQRAGVMYTVDDRDEDIPFRVECDGTGGFMSYNMVGGNDIPVGGRGLHGIVIPKSQAEELAFKRFA